MQCRRVQCPACKALLSLPPECPQRVVRCGQCRSRFRLPSEIRVTDEAIVDWLREPLAGAETGEPATPQAPPQVDLAGDVPTSGNTAILPAIGGSLHLVRVDGKGAWFEFPASRLLDPAFRCAMPRRCLQCGASVHLRTHVVIFSPQFKESLSLEAEHSVGELTLPDADLGDLSGQQLLDRLPHVPNVPHPGDLPMPYWLCDLCGTAAAVAGQIQVDDQTGEGRCGLLIGNLRRAEEFLVAAAGLDTPDHAALREHIVAQADNPWEALPLVVQQRLKQWFRPEPGERFIAFVPDRDQFDSEEGMVGIAITSRRLIYHTQRRHSELPAREPLSLKRSSGEGKSFLQVDAPTCQIKHFCVDGEGLRKLHRAFAVGKFNVAWR